MVSVVSRAQAAARSLFHVSANVDPVEWDAFVLSRRDATGNHLSAWQHVYREAFRHVPVYLAARGPDGRIAGVLPLVTFNHRIFGRFLVSLPFVNYGGIVASSEAAARVLLDAATEHARDVGAAHVELRHTRRWFPELPVREHKVSMTLALEGDAVHAWNALDRKVRNQIRKAEKHGLEAEVGGEALLGEFYDVFAVNMRDLGTPVYPKEWFDRILAYFPQRARIVVVRHGKTVVAGALTFTHPDRVEIPSASSLREYRPMCANNLLYWRIIQQAIADGARVLDFGRSTPEEGTYRFKEQWGCRPGPMAWEYQLMGGAGLPARTPDNPKFRAAVATWQRLPIGVATWLGPYIVRYLP